MENFEFTKRLFHLLLIADTNDNYLSMKNATLNFCLNAEILCTTVQTQSFNSFRWSPLVFLFFFGSERDERGI